MASCLPALMLGVSGLPPSPGLWVLPANHKIHEGRFAASTEAAAQSPACSQPDPRRQINSWRGEAAGWGISLL